MNRTTTWGIMALAFLFFASRANADLIVNGGFEMPVTAGDTTLSAGDTSLTGWMISSGSIDVISSSVWAPYAGNQSIDLDGNSAGSIFQSFATMDGTQYTLSFAYANNPLGGTVPGTAFVNLTGAGILVAMSISHGTSTLTNMDYSLFSTTFTANSTSATLIFGSGDPANSVGGIVLDSVSVDLPSVAPEPSTMLMGCTVLAVAGGSALRRRLRNRTA